jgi:hypothetical protein
MNGLLDEWIMEYTKRRNLNRGYMKLEVWQRGMDMFDLNKLLALITSIEAKRCAGGWQDSLPTDP